MKMKSIAKFQALTLGATLVLSSSLQAQWSNGRKANAVLGQRSFTSMTPGLSARKLEYPSDVAVDPASGKVFVADQSNHRILRYGSTAAMQKGAPAEAVFGQPNFTTDTAGTDQHSFTAPIGVFVDNQGRLWVADTGNNRVLRFDNASTLGNQPDADSVLGQANFTSDTDSTTQSGMSGPRDVALDNVGNLWVADRDNDRVLKFASVLFKPNGANADVVLGQPDFTSSSTTLPPPATPTGMHRPYGIVVRTVRKGLIISTELWVSDYSNNRVLRFDDATVKTNGAAADGVLGQPDLMSSDPVLSPIGMNRPGNLAMDASGHLWVRAHNRILRYNDVGSKPDGGPADLILGQSDFTENEIGASSTRFFGPAGIAVDPAGNLFVADNSNHRVLRFSPGHAQPDNLVGKNANPGTQRGDNILNTSAVGQTIKIRRKNRKVARAFFTLQNEGPYDDRFRLRATRRNRKMKVKYFRTTGGRANITGQIVTGNYLADVGYRSALRLMAKTRVTKRGLKKRRAKRRLSLQSTSLDNGRSDRVLAKVVLVQKRKRR